MRRMILNSIRFTIALTALAAAGVRAQEPKTAPLPKPQIVGGKPLMQALNERMSRGNSAPRNCPSRCWRTCCGLRSA